MSVYKLRLPNLSSLAVQRLSLQKSKTFFFKSLLFPVGIGFPKNYINRSKLLHSWGGPVMRSSENTFAKVNNIPSGFIDSEVFDRSPVSLKTTSMSEVLRGTTKDNNKKYNDHSLKNQFINIDSLVDKYSSQTKSASLGITSLVQGQETSPGDVFRINLKPDNTALHLLYEIQEEAAKRIAHRLHDESAQMLATVYLELAEIARDCSDLVNKKIEKVVAHLDEVSEQLRKLSHELRPIILDQLGLMPALQLLASGVRKRSGMTIAVSGSVEGKLAKNIETVLYRVVQEALSNVVRHAGATHVKVSLWIENKKVCCTVADNGIGFKVEKEKSSAFYGLGFVGIHERLAMLNGNCHIVSSWGKGMKLQIEVPL